MNQQHRKDAHFWRLLETFGVVRGELRQRDLRAAIASHLGTTDPRAIVAAIADYVGTYEHAEEYVARRLVELLPPGFGWIAQCCDPSELRRRYEIEVCEVWTIPAEGGGVHVFESMRRSRQ